MDAISWSFSMISSDFFSRIFRIDLFQWNLRMNIKLIKRATQLLGLFCILAAILAACSSSPATVIATNVPAVNSVGGTYWPTEDWRTSTPEDQGMEAEKLAEMLAAIQGQHLNLHSLLVIRNGYVVSETYFGSYQQDTRRETYSVTKSFVATLIGIAIDKGYVDGVDHRIVDFFPERTLAKIGRRETLPMEKCIEARIGSSSCWISQWPYHLEASSTIVRDARICYPPSSSKRRA
jgi:hypothetical protein